MTLLSEAKSCPFCSGHGEKDTYGLWFWDKGIPGKWAVACSNPACGATGPIADTALAAVAIWNTALRRRD